MGQRRLFILDGGLELGVLSLPDELNFTPQELEFVDSRQLL